MDNWFGSDSLAQLSKYVQGWLEESTQRDFTDLYNVIFTAKWSVCLSKIRVYQTATCNCYDDLLKT